MISDEIKSKNIEKMFKAGVHFGYSRSSRHPNIKDFIFGIRNNVEVFDLEKVSKRLNEVKEFAKNLGKDKKVVLLVGTKIEAKDLIEKFAKEIGMPYVSQRWLGGTLTNFKLIRKRIDYFNDLSQKKDSGELKSKYTKKEIMLIEKDLMKFRRYFEGLTVLNSLPGALIIIDPCEEKIAVKEAKKVSVPVIAIVNSDCDPESVTHPAPGNDSSHSSIEYFLDELVKSYKEGLKQVTSNE